MDKKPSQTITGEQSQANEAFGESSGTPEDTMTDSQRNNLAQTPQNIDAQLASETDNQSSDTVDGDDSAEGQVDDPPAGTGQSPTNTDDRQLDAAGGAEPEHSSKLQQSRVAADDVNPETVAAVPDNEKDSEKEIDNNEAAAENSALGADTADSVDNQTDAPMQPASLDADADQNDQAQGSSEEATTTKISNDAPSSDNTDNERADTSPRDNHPETIADEKEAAADHTDITSAETDPVEAETDAPDKSPSSDTDADRQTRENSEGKCTLQPDTEEPSGTPPDDGADLPKAEDPADDDLEEEIDGASATGSSYMKIVVTAIMITALFSGLFIFDNKSKIMKDKTEKLQTLKDEQQPSKREKKEVLDIQVVAATSVYDSQINDITALRDILLKKQAEVLTLKQRYQRSIAELEKEILDEQRRTGIHTFLQATGNKRIVYSLKTIQRRQAYIGQLELPLAWVSGACEELLYLKRRVITDLQVSSIASGINMDSHAQQMQGVLEKYQPTADKLAIDATEARLESLETIWEQVQNKQNQSSPEQAYSRNQIIANQICAGDFDRIGELSEISARTAKCIVQMNGSDLFLNQITEISPGAAKQLCHWKGSWLCMNSIRALSPRVAHYLFQWNGDWISLNGLTAFPAEIGEQLLKWGGGQLELMGLQNAADSSGKIGIQYLAEWEKSGGKLFVPKNIREKIDALHRQSG